MSQTKTSSLCRLRDSLCRLKRYSPLSPQLFTLAKSQSLHIVPTQRSQSLHIVPTPHMKQYQYHMEGTRNTSDLESAASHCPCNLSPGVIYLILSPQDTSHTPSDISPRLFPLSPQTHKACTHLSTAPMTRLYKDLGGLLWGYVLPCCVVAAVSGSFCHPSWTLVVMATVSVHVAPGASR